MKNKRKLLIGILIVVVLAIAGLAIYFSQPSSENAAGTSGGSRQRPPAIGTVGVATTPLSPEGTAEFDRQVFPVTSISGKIDIRQQVQVEHIDEGGRILVSKCRTQAPI